MSKSTHPLMQLLVMVAISMGMMVVTSLLTGVAAFLALLSGGDGSLTMTREFLMWTQAITPLLTFAMPVLITTAIYYRGRQRDYYKPYFGGSHWLAGLAAVVVMLLMTPFIEWLSEWNDHWNLGALGESLRSLQDTTEGVLDTITETRTVGGLLANLVVIALIPAVTEELFFRCGIQNLLARWTKNHHIAIWITAAIFSLAHAEIFSFMPRLLMGAMLGYFYVYGGSVLPNMLAHFVNNAVVVLACWLVARMGLDIDIDHPFATGWLLTASCTLAALLLFAVTFVKRRKANA